MAITDVVEAIADTVWHLFRIFLMLIVAVAIIGALCWAYYIGFKPSTNEHAQVINNTSYYPSKRLFFLGFSLWGADIGISKYADPAVPSIKN